MFLYQNDGVFSCIIENVAKKYLVRYAILGKLGIYTQRTILKREMFFPLYRNIVIVTDGLPPITLFTAGRLTLLMRCFS